VQLVFACVHRALHAGVHVAVPLLAATLHTPVPCAAFVWARSGEPADASSAARAVTSQVYLGYRRCGNGKEGSALSGAAPCCCASTCKTPPRPSSRPGSHRCLKISGTCPQGLSSRGDGQE